MTIDTRNKRVYNKVITSDEPQNFSQISLIGKIIRNVSVDEYLGINAFHRCVYRCHCTKCNQELILSTKMLADSRTHLCYCDIPKKRLRNISNNNLVDNLGKYAKKKYNFDIKDPEIKPLFNRWVNIRQRCNNPNSNSYPHYGARGIKVCQEWDNTEDGFLNFYNWAINSGWKPNKDLSIDRIDVDKGYSPDNCRWADDKLQCSNQTKNRYIQYNQWIFPLSIWAELAGLDYYRFYMRLKNGWTFEKAMFTKTNYSNNKVITVPDEYELYNKYQEWVDNGKILPIDDSLSITHPIITYFNI